MGRRKAFEGGGGAWGCTPGHPVKGTYSWSKDDLSALKIV